MGVYQGDPALLNDPIAQELLRSTIPARLAYTGTDGTPRVVAPSGCHWTGQEVVIASPPDAPKLKALQANPRVALTIDAEPWPHKVLLLRGPAQVEIVDGVPSEYEAAARRYFGEEQGAAWTDQVRSCFHRRRGSPCGRNGSASSTSRRASRSALAKRMA